MIPKIIKYDPYLKPYRNDLVARMENYASKKQELTGGGSLSDFANGHKYFGLHLKGDTFIYREWAPGADAMYVTGDFNNWNLFEYQMQRKENGVFEIKIKDRVLEGHYVQAIVVKNGEVMRRVPAYAKRVVQDRQTTLWTAVVMEEKEFPWTDESFKIPTRPFVYECHIGMAQEKYDIGTYKEFEENTLPRIKKLGYNTIQIMAVMEHPYYASFGYQVSNFFAASSRFGMPDELKSLINKAHEMGIAVLLDIVHSHAVKNVGEGLNMFDGTSYQYFHEGAKGDHPAWDTRLFDYSKNEVLHFLLSNVKFWMEEYHFDGFRFDGVTSMLYHDHGLGSAFMNYDMYFSMNTDTDAITYLCLANDLIHEINPKAISIAEDMSGMPGMCLPLKDGGIGFDYRLSMGIPDLWIKYLKETPDEYWHLGTLWYELSNSRIKEKNISYCESHDQALVGDKTIMFRLCDSEMYTSMSYQNKNTIIDRGVALHKMIRFLTLSLSEGGYLNFMGNEFGHPEWIDFPREGNGWSHHYCRRQWSLVDNEELLYPALNRFDAAMLAFAKKERLFSKKAEFNMIHEEDKILSFYKKDLLFIFNFHPTNSYPSYHIPAKDGEYKVVFTSDDSVFAGFNRVDKNYIYKSENGFDIYTPSRTVIVLKKQ